MKFIKESLLYEMFLPKSTINKSLYYKNSHPDIINNTSPVNSPTNDHFF